MKQLHKPRSRVLRVLPFLVGAALAQTAWAAEKDITQECCIWGQGLVGPGSISFKTNGDTMFSLGANVRIIPTYEDNWDFGISDKNAGLAVGDTFYASHFVEAGVVAKEYMRGQANIFLNALPQDRSWSAFIWLQQDSVLDVPNVDQNAGAGNQQSDFGIERLHLTSRLDDMNMRLHAGWDLWEVDMGPGGGLVYLEDNPGIWLTGWDNNGAYHWSAGWFKLKDNNFSNGSSFAVSDNIDDRNLFAGWLEQKVSLGAIRYFYTYDQIRGVTVGEIPALFGGHGASAAAGTGTKSDADVHHLGAYFNGKLGGWNAMLEGVYEFGSADTSLAQGDFDVSAYGFAGMFSYPMKSLTPRLGFTYTSGDDNASDDKLGGYTANLAGQRYTAFGGENTILNDTNMVLGTALFGLLPEGLGNGTPVFTGGIENFAGFGFGRGDNPGIWLVSLGMDSSLSPKLNYSTTVNVFGWNEDFVVASSAAANRTTVKAGYAGTEWLNQLSQSLNKNTTIKYQLSALFPGEGIEDLTRAIGAGGAVNTASDDVALRAAVELVWNF